jgi:hypothetical protein
MKSIRRISWIGALLIGMLFPAIGNCYIYQVKLSDGRVLKVKQYYEKGDTIFLLRYGNYIGMDKNTVIEITKIKDPAEVPNSIPANQKSSSTRGSSSRNTARTSTAQRANTTTTSTSQKTGTGTTVTTNASGDKLKSAVEPFKRLASGN